MGIGQCSYDFVPTNQIFLLVDDCTKYEKFCTQNRSAFELESWVLEWSTIFISVILFVLIIPPLKIIRLNDQPDWILGIVFIVILFVGIGLTLIIKDIEKSLGDKLQTNSYVITLFLHLFKLHLLKYKSNDNEEQQQRDYQRKYLKESIKLLLKRIEKDKKKYKNENYKDVYNKKNPITECYQNAYDLFLASIDETKYSSNIEFNILNLKDNQILNLTDNKKLGELLNDENFELTKIDNK